MTCRQMSVAFPDVRALVAVSLKGGIARQIDNNSFNFWDTWNIIITQRFSVCLKHPSLAEHSRGMRNQLVPIRFSVVSITREWHMSCMERFAELLCARTVEEWRTRIFKLGRDLGYEQTRLAILPDRNAPIEAEYAFQHSNYSSDWLNKYTAQRMHHIDPTFAHCVGKSIPLIWSPEIFASREQKEMYEEACGYGIRSGVAFPIHGARGELGIMCLVSKEKPSRSLQLEAMQCIPELSCLRDYVFESSLQFIMHSARAREHIRITSRELECLKWSAVGKSSWEIGYLLNCTEATVNFHFSNIRRKFNTHSRQQAVVRAINLGLINPT